LAPSEEDPLKHNTVLIALSLLNALFFGLHLTGDIVFGIEQGGREILVGVLILAVCLYGAVGLPERLAGYIILLLGGLASALLPVIHTMARPLGEQFAQLPGGFFFIWTLLTTGATGSSHLSCPCRQSGAFDSAGVLPRKDRYERMIGIVFLGDLNVNLELVKRGHAWAYRQYMRTEDSALCINEAAARTAKKGLWASRERPVAPWEWRRKKTRAAFTDYSRETAPLCIAAIGKS
jgi:hypothetical protein